MGSEINMGYDSIFDPRQLNQVYSACPLLVYTYHTQFFIHRQNSTRLTQALCLTLLFFRLLSSVSPQVLREGTQQLDLPQHPA